MRKLILYLLALVPVTVSAQTFEELKKADPLFYCELYRPYPADRISDLTPAPKGYVPFYVSHLGRHGSRWNVGGFMYDEFLKILEEADREDELMPLGRRLLEDWRATSKEGIGREGDLSPMGFREHKGIAERLCKSYPEIFAKHKDRKSRIVCRSTVVPRCILSMASFSNEIQRNFPWVEASLDASNSIKYLKAYATLNAVLSQSKPASDSARMALMPESKPFVDRLFRKGGKVSSSIEDTEAFMLRTYLAVANPAVENGTDYCSYLFSEDELASLWRAANARRYYLEGPSARFGRAIMGGPVALVENILECADRAVEKGDVCGDFRFAHDVTIVALTKLLGVRFGQIETDDINAIGRSWQINRISTMAANIQLIFFRNRKGDILVKLLHCEQEQRLADEAGTPVDGFYYRWSDFRNFLVRQIEYYKQ